MRTPKGKPPKWSFYRKTVPGFPRAVRTPEEVAIQAARGNKELGFDVAGGAAVALDPRDDLGRIGCALLFARDRGLTPEQALRFVDAEIAAYAKKGVAPIMGAWAPLVAVQGLLQYPGLVLGEDYEAWLSEVPEPGFVRLASVSAGRAFFSVVAYEAKGTA